MNDRQHIWMELDYNSETTNCDKCGIKIWKFWYNPSVKGAEGNTEDVNYPEMTKCGPCFFGYQ